MTILSEGTEHKPSLAVDGPHSDFCFLVAFPTETIKAFLAGHVRAFAYFAGVPTRIIQENSKIAVAGILGGDERQRTRAFSLFESGFLLADKFGRPAIGNEKGKVEGWDRERRATERHISLAKFPVVKTVKTMDSFDFLAIPTPNKTLVLEPARCQFLARRENLLLLGNCGSGTNLHRSGPRPGCLPVQTRCAFHHYRCVGQRASRGSQREEIGVSTKGPA